MYIILSSVLTEWKCFININKKIECFKADKWIKIMQNLKKIAI